MLTTQKRMEKTSRIFCGFSKISALSSPFGKRNGMSCQESQQGQQREHGALFKNSHSVIQQTNMSVFSLSCHRARCMWHRDFISYHNRDHFLDDARHCHRGDRKSTSTGVPFVGRRVARHGTCYLSRHIQLLESKAKTCSFPQSLPPSVLKIVQSAI